MTWLESMSPINMSLLVMVVIVCLVLWQWHRNDDQFHLQQVLVDNVTGKIAIEKVGYMSALALGSWGFAALIQTGEMTEGYFTAYLGVFALSRAASSGFSVYKDIRQGQTPVVNSTPSKDQS